MSQSKLAASSCAAASAPVKGPPAQLPFMMLYHTPVFHWYPDRYIDSHGMLKEEIFMAHLRKLLTMWHAMCHAYGHVLVVMMTSQMRIHVSAALSLITMRNTTLAWRKKLRQLALAPIYTVTHTAEKIVRIHCGIGNGICICEFSQWYHVCMCGANYFAASGQLFHIITTHLTPLQ